LIFWWGSSKKSFFPMAFFITLFSNFCGLFEEKIIRFSLLLSNLFGRSKSASTRMMTHYSSSEKYAWQFFCSFFASVFFSRRQKKVETNHFRSWYGRTSLFFFFTVVARLRCIFFSDSGGCKNREKSRYFMKRFNCFWNSDIFSRSLSRKREGSRFVY